MYVLESIFTMSGFFLYALIIPSHVDVDCFEYARL